MLQPEFRYNFRLQLPFQLSCTTFVTGHSVLSSQSKTAEYEARPSMYNTNTTRATRAILLWATPVGLRPTGLRPVWLFYYNKHTEANTTHFSDNECRKVMSIFSNLLILVSTLFPLWRIILPKGLFTVYRIHVVSLVLQVSLTQVNILFEHWHCRIASPAISVMVHL